MKKVLAIIIVLALLILQVPAAVFAVNDVERIIIDLKDTITNVDDRAALLGKIWDYTVAELNDDDAVTSEKILLLIKNDQDSIIQNLWDRYIDNNSTSDDTKISEATLLAIIDEMLTNKGIIIDIHDTYGEIISTTYIKTALGLPANASESAVLTKLIEKSGPILTSSGNTFSRYPGAGSTLVNKLSLTGVDGTVVAAYFDAQLEVLAGKINTYVNTNGYISKDSVIALLGLYNMYGTPSTPTNPTNPSSPGGGSSGTTPAPTVDKGNITLPATLDSSGTASAKVPADTLSKAFANATAAADGTKTVTIKLNAVTNAKAYAPVLPAANLSATDNKQRIVVETPLGNLNLPGNMFKAADLGKAADVKVSIGVTDASSVKDEALKAQIGNRPVIELSVSVDGTAKAWDNPDSPVTVEVKYTPTEDELKNPDFITIYYIDGAGNVVAVPNARYNASTGTVVFSTTHFSKYAVAYVHNTFSDLEKFSWAKPFAEVLASKGILTGVSKNEFAPQTIISRDEFIAGLIRALGLSAKVESNFSDVDSSSAYYNEIGIAKKLGITSGIGDNKFGVGTSITRQDMIVLTEKALKYAGKQGTPGTDADIANFTDKSKIRENAKESVATAIRNGIILGNNNVLDPTGNLTKAQAAVVIYKVFKK
jgi:hypothetical protein